MTMYIKYKAADTLRYSYTTAAADDDLFFTLEANSSYLIRGLLFLRGSTAGDIRIGWSVGGATVTRGSGFMTAKRTIQADSVVTSEEVFGIVQASDYSSGATRYFNMTTGAYRMPVAYTHLITIGASGGTFSLTWRQKTADAVDPAKVLAGSIMQYEKIP